MGSSDVAAAEAMNETRGEEDWYKEHEENLLEEHDKELL